MNNNSNNNRRSDGNSKGVIVKESYSQNLISTILNASKQSKLITIKYYSNEKGLTERVIEPMGVIIRMGKKNLVGWCRLRNDWRTFRMDRINFITIHMNESFEAREDYRRENFEDEGSNFEASNQNSERGERQERSDRGDNRNRDKNVQSRPSNKDFGFSTEGIKTMSENKLNFSKDNVVEYSEDEDDLAL
jgi:predicted DNA-binding transcriptional regulator YafY